jgi:Flp pilus assembly pilin Flp
MKRFWEDQCGAILSAELVLLMTILVIGMIVGLKALQDAVVNELGDVAAAIGALNQSYSFSGIQGNGGISAMTAGSIFTDAVDNGDITNGSNGVTSATPGSIDVTSPSATAE